MTYGKNATLRNYRRLFFRGRSRDECATNWCTNLNVKLLVRVRVGDGLAFRVLPFWLSLGHLAGLRGSSLRFPCEATKPAVPRQGTSSAFRVIRLQVMVLEREAKK